MTGAADLAGRIGARGLVLVGCGRMGGALLRGWLARGVPAGAVTVIDPQVAPEWQDRGLRLNADAPADPAALVLAVKPQMMGAALPGLTAGPGTLVLSIAAGTTLATLAAAFPRAPIVRAMPNTPAAIGQGITALVASPRADLPEMALAEALMAAVGRVVRLDHEAQMDAVTGLSGSGPAYVFHLIEALAAAGAAEGLPEPLALDLARATVAGAGALAMEDPSVPPSRLREDVTSPNGTTAAGLAVLMDARAGLAPLVARTVAAAAARSRALGR